MIIYPSTQVRPYVYMGIHKVTKQLYIGYREANVKLGRPSHIDIFMYMTSSITVKPIFDEFDWSILVETNAGVDAYDIEQELIFENWDNPLLLNAACHYGKMRFRRAKDPWNKGKSELYFHSAETKSIIRRKRKDQLFSDVTCNKISISLLGNTRATGEKWTERTRAIQKLARANCSDITRQKRSIAMLKWHSENNSGMLNNHHSQETKDQISKTTTGVKKAVITCPHCGKIGGVNVMYRWHFDNCKSLLPVRPKTTICPRCGIDCANNGRLARFHFNNCKKLLVPKIVEQQTCPHCGKTGKVSDMTRFHFEKCKVLKVKANPVSKLKLLTCPFCKKSGRGSSMRQYHFDKCELSPNPKLRTEHKKETCPHCNKCGSAANMSRWHFANCKYKL